jgi:hypothetical protein
MRLTDSRLWIPALAFLAFACAPCHRRPGPHGMGTACGPGSCAYMSQCFSEGATRSNDGVCQACSAGKWVAATGCQEHHCGGKMCASGPCEAEHARGKRHH